MKQFKYVVVGDCAIDKIFPVDQEMYLKFCAAMAALDKKEASDEEKARAIFRLANAEKVSVHSIRGGPVFNIAQYLRARDQDVSVVSVIGTNKESKRFRLALEKKGIDTAGLLEREGKMPKCLYVYESPEHQLPGIWRGNASERPYLPSSDMYKHFLDSHDVLVLSVTHPKTAVQAVKDFDHTIAYNPGPYLNFIGFAETKFSEIVQKTHILSTNEAEANIIKAALGLKEMKGLFERHPHLEYIITTLGKAGSEIHQRNEKSYRYQRKVDENLRMVDDIGAGDAYFATAVHQLMRGNDLADVVLAASTAAEQSLRHRGAANYDLDKEEATPYTGITRVEH